MADAVSHVCGDAAADWFAQLLYHVRAPYITCWPCDQSARDTATPIPRYRVSGWVSLVPLAAALLFSLVVLYLWRVYGRRMRYIQTKLQESNFTIYVTDDDQSESANVGHTLKDLAVELTPPESPSGHAQIVDPALLPFIQPISIARR